MKKSIYSIYDEKADSFNPPFLATTNQLAIRVFNSFLMTDPIMKSFKADFKLYFVGTFDEDTADFVSCCNKLVASGSDCDKIEV